MRDSDVGRNKSARRQQGLAFPALPGLGMPETPVPRSTRGQAYSPSPSKEEVAGTYVDTCAVVLAPSVASLNSQDL